MSNIHISALHSLFYKPIVYVSPIAHGENLFFLKDVLNDSELYPEIIQGIKVPLRI